MDNFKLRHICVFSINKNMKSEENIVFLGMMGSGKSTIGKLISKKLKLEFFDIDNCIEKKTGMKITKIFNDYGEKFFREIEEKVTLQILKKKNIVIALGGGGFLNNKIRKEILSNHLSFWLNLSSEQLLKRLLKSTKRPLAKNLTKNELINMIKKRSNFYSKSLYKINCDNLSKIEIINKILNIYETN